MPSVPPDPPVSRGAVLLCVSTGKDVEVFPFFAPIFLESAIVYVLFGHPPLSFVVGQ